MCLVHQSPPPRFSPPVQSTAPPGGRGDPQSRQQHSYPSRAGTLGGARPFSWATTPRALDLGSSPKKTKQATTTKCYGGRTTTANIADVAVGILTWRLHRLRLWSNLWSLTNHKTPSVKFLTNPSFHPIRLSSPPPNHKARQAALACTPLRTLCVGRSSPALPVDHKNKLKNRGEKKNRGAFALSNSTVPRTPSLLSEMHASLVATFVLCVSSCDPASSWLSYAVARGNGKSITSKNICTLCFHLASVL